MKLQDYLHFYLGCDCKAKWFNLQFESEQKLMPDDLTRFKKTLITSIKPILRPLSDMTEEEKLQANEMWDNNYDISCYHADAASTHYLLSKHFDLFGLIDAGLAIDKTKLNKEPSVEASVATEGDSSN